MCVEEKGNYPAFNRAAKSRQVMNVRGYDRVAIASYSIGRYVEYTVTYR